MNDQRSIADVGITDKASGIQIIEKPMFAALLEMVADVSNVENIPWFDQAMQSLSVPHRTNYYYRGSGLEFDGKRRT